MPQKAFGIYPILFLPKLFDIIFVIPLILKYFKYVFKKIEWEKKYKSVGIENYPFKWRLNFKNLKKVIKEFRKIKSNNEIFIINSSGIEIGDLIYDTYLRFYNQPTISKKSFGLFVIIYQSYNYLDKLNEIYNNTKIDKYFSSYCTYINHGIPVRFFIHKNINVFSSGNIFETIKKHKKNDFYQVKSPNYSRLIENKKSEIGIKKIRKRIEGFEKLPFMKTHTYHHENTLCDINIDNFEGILFLHDFLDSPHIYGQMIFDDFYKWTLFTLNLIKENSLKIAIKPHPNQIEKSKQIVNKLKSVYSELSWIDENTSNNKLLNSDIKFGISVYGSIIGELAYFGKFSFTCGNNPYQNFSFIKNSNSIEEYRENILNSLDQKTNYDFTKEVGSFYYQLYHNKKEFYEISKEIIENRFDESFQKKKYDISK